MGKARRLELSVILHQVMASNSKPENVYFQPGPDITMDYPCIAYERDDAAEDYADNIKYYWMQRYTVTYIDKEPDSDVFDALMELPYSSFNRHFATSGLNHDVFTIYH